MLTPASVASNDQESHVVSHWSFIEKTSVKQDPNLKCVQILGCPFALKSDVPPVEASSGQEQYYIRSSLTFAVRHTQLRCTPLVEASHSHLVAKSTTTSGQLDICSALVDLSSDVVTIQNCHILDLPHFCICQYYSFDGE